MKPPSSPPGRAPPGSDPYALLGLSPGADDVVVRAAYRALMNKLTAGQADPEAAAREDPRAREVQSAYAVLGDPLRRRDYDARMGYPPPGPATLAAEAGPEAPRLVMRPADADDPFRHAPPPTAAPRPAGPARVATPPPRPPPPEDAAALGAMPMERPRRRAPLLVGGLAVLALTAVVAGVALLRPPREAVPAQSESALEALPQAPAGAAPVTGPLPCYVDGRSVGALTLSDCAARNGVSRGPLDTGVGGQPPSSLAQAAPPTPPPLAEAPAREPPPDAGPPDAAPEPADAPAPRPAPTARSAPPRFFPPNASPPPPLASPATDPSVAVARAFYSALGEGAPARAADLVAPDRRDRPGLSAARIAAFTGGVSDPLKVTAIRPAGPGTVVVRYRFGDAAGRPCGGTATVETVQRGEAVMIGAIRSTNAC